jgi:hypothetical protein
VNVTVKEAVWPAGIVKGNCTPDKENSGVLTEADVTVTFDPLAVSFAGKLPLFPIGTVPKFKLAGERASCPTAVPDPDNARFIVEFEALDAIAIFP